MLYYIKARWSSLQLTRYVYSPSVASLKMPSSTANRCVHHRYKVKSDNFSSERFDGPARTSNLVSDHLELFQVE